MKHSPSKLNRDFYIQMRIKGYSHDTIVTNVFPPERLETFVDDIKGLEDIDYTKKVSIDKLVNANDEVKPKKKTTTKKDKKLK